MNENRSLIKRRHPGLSLSDFAKKAGELWHDLRDKSVNMFRISFMNSYTQVHVI